MSDTSKRPEWSRNFGVVANDSSGTELEQYIVTLSRIDPTIYETDSAGNRKDTKVKVSNLGAVQLRGLMTNNISYSLTANWEVSNNQVSSMIQKGYDVVAGSITGFTRLGGIEGTSAGYATRKVYKGGTDVSLTINFRLFDANTNLRSENDTGIDTSTSVLDGVAWINTIMIPTNKAAITIKAFEDFTNKIAEGRQTAEEAAEATKREEVAKKQLKEIEDNLSSLGDAAKATFNVLEGNAAAELKAFSFNLTASPPPIKIEIGNWLRIKEGVVTNASFNFSDKMNKKGPLFCDVALQISTRENLMFVADDANEYSSIPQFELFK